MSTILKLLTTVICFISISANASLIRSNFNGFDTVIDTNSTLEWMNLDATKNLSINEVNSLLSTTFSGFRLPTQEEVFTLIDNSLPSTLRLNHEWHIDTYVDSNEAHNFLNFFTNTSEAIGNYIYEDSSGNSVFFAGIQRYISGGNSVYHAYKYYPVTRDFDYKRSDIGVYLVKGNGSAGTIAVPEPSTIVTLAFAILGFLFTQKVRARKA